MSRFHPLAVPIFLLAIVLTAAAPPAHADVVFVRGLCADGTGAIGTNWVSIPTHTDLTTAESICLAAPGALVVAQAPESTTSVPTQRYEYDCATGACTAATGVVPEPGCVGSACFCVDRGEGVEILTAADAPMVLNGCDTFVRVDLPAGFRRYLVSVPYDTPLASFNDLAIQTGLPASGVIRGTITGIDCPTGTVISCQAGTAACLAAVLVPGEAYVLGPTTTAGMTFTNPAACSPIPVPAVGACPIEDLRFDGAGLLTWSLPAGCPLPALYDTRRGTVACLRGFCTNELAPLANPCPGCVVIEDDDIDLLAADPGIPDPGEGFWYLVRVEGGTWNNAAATKCTNFDLMISPACP